MATQRILQVSDFETWFGVSGPSGPDNATPLTGLLYGGGLQVLTAQAIGSAIVTSATFAIALIVMLVINAFGILRVSREGELRGLDLFEHGISAYPEYVISSSGLGTGQPVGSVAIGTQAPITSAEAGAPVSSGRH